MKKGEPSGRVDARQGDNRRAWQGIARAFGGAILFAFPLLMTMEMWWLGFHLDRLRLALSLLLFIPLLLGLSYYVGFEETYNWLDDMVDVGVALAIGFVTSATTLLLIAVIGPGMSADEIIGKISLQTIPASMGAMLARSQIVGGEDATVERRRRKHYSGDLFMMLVGALFLSLTLAPTEETVLIALKMAAWHAVALALASLLIMQAFVYAAEVGGEGAVPKHAPLWNVILRFTVTGYAIALLTSLVVLWLFGRTEGTGLERVVSSAIVLGFPAALGASAARIIL